MAKPSQCQKEKDVRLMIIRIRHRKGTHSAVTLELLLQVTPSQGSPHGSLDLSQLGGVFCHVLLRDWRAAADQAQPFIFQHGQFSDGL